MVNEAESEIDRFRRIAKLNRIALKKNFDDPQNEIETTRAALNASFYARAESWMMPRWMNQKDTTLEGENPLLFNDEYNNWITIGGVGSDNFAIMDAAGLLSKNPDSCSIDFWYQEDDGLLIPGTETNEQFIEMPSPEDQIYHSEHTCGPVNVQRLVFYGKQDDKEYVFNELLLKSTSLEPTKYTFFIAVRPYNQFGIAPIERIDYHDNTRKLCVDGSIVLISDIKPEAVIMSTVDNPNLKDAITQDVERVDHSYSTKMGLATAVVRFSVELPPAERRSIFFATPLSDVNCDTESSSPLLNERSRDRAIAEWFEFSGRKLAGMYPTEEITQTLSQAKANLAIQARSEIQNHLQQPNFENMVDVARTIVAVSRCGCPNAVEDLLTIDNLQSPSDFLSYLPIVYALSELHLMHPNFAKEEYNAIRQSVNKYLSEITEFLLDKYPPLNESNESGMQQEPDEEIIKLDKTPTNQEYSSYEPFKYDWQLINIPLLLFILKFIEIALNSSNESDSDEDRILLETQMRCKDLLGKAEEELLTGDLSKVINSTEKVLAALEIISTSSLLKDESLNREVLFRLAVHLDDHYTVRGLIRTSADEKQVKTYHSLQLAGFFALLGKRNRADRILSKVLNFLSQYHTFSETINLNTWGGGWGSGSSIKAARDLIILIRDMFLIEEDNRLVVGRGIPEDWLVTEKAIVIKGIPSVFGPIGLEFAPSANQHQIEIIMDEMPDELEVHIPSHIALHMVKVYGGAIIEKMDSTHSVRIVPLNESVVLVYHKI